LGFRLGTGKTLLAKALAGGRAEGGGGGGGGNGVRVGR
jgi:hypothetical protein